MRQQQEQTTSYHIHGIDQPKARVTKEKPSRIPTFRIDVFVPTLIFGLLVFLACVSFYIKFWPGGVTAIVTLAFFLVRLYQVFDVPFVDFEEAEFQQVGSKMVQQPNRTIPHNRNGEVPIRNSKKLRGPLGEIELSGRQLDQLVKIINDPDGDGRLRREASGLGKGVYGIGITTTQFSVFEEALKGKGFIDSDKIWTAEGRAWAERP